TKKHEFFRITRLNNNETQVNIFKISKEGEIKNQPLYSRKFLTKETKEIRLYGIDGNDIFHVEGKVDDGITIRIIGGPDKDSLFENSSVKGGTHKTKFYDNPGTSITASPETKIRMDDSTFVYPFDEEFKYDVKGSRIAPGLNTFYRLFVGVGFKKRIHGWREKPFKYEQEYGVNFSLTEKSFHPYYRAIHPQIFSSWNLKYGLGFDGIRRINFFGIGNETINRSLADEKFNWLRTRNIYSFFGLDQFISKYHNIGFELTYDGVMVVPDDGRFISESNQQIDPSTFKWKHFGGTRITYSFLKINDRILPTKGADFTSSLSYTLNLKDRERSLTRLSSNLKLYIPIWNDISLFTNSGAATLWGQPEFYQYNNIGGGITLRGFVRTRFYGKSVVYQQNELRWLPTVRSYLFNGKAGLVALYDFGRVFIPGESSDKWHSAYGGGFVLSPFNKISATVLYSVSDEDRLFNLRLGMFF
ncbi:MAG TPA: hypothetical protein VM368_02860, partial [Flavisolibacter sp.]|nr:hypothetical protein [Flavisolibacter sp.]